MGRPKGTVSLTYLIREELERDGEDAARELIHTVIEQARSGSFKHLKEIIDRIDGPVAHRVEGILPEVFKAIDREAFDKV